VHLGRVAPLSAFDLLITDAAADASTLGAFRKAGLGALQPEQ